MRLTDIVQPDWIKVPLAAQTKQAAVEELVDVLADHGGPQQRDEIKTAVWQREVMRSTGIGHGVAIPHGKCAGATKLCLAIGTLAKPIDYGAIDTKPVDIIFLLVSPQDQTGPHIQALAGISRILSDPALRQALKTVTSATQLYDIIAQADAKTPG
jgi:mannitol/fructose-specific phosphotransferase system IIA component (Ntr-type)